MRSTAVQCRAGFTLVELLVALAIAGLTLMLAYSTYAAVTDGARALQRGRAQLNRVRNRERWLGEAFGALEIGQPGSVPFDGTPNSAAFSTWLRMPQGWVERRQVMLALNAGQLQARISPGEPVVLADSVAAVAFDYLLVPGADARWARAWQSPVSAPLAVRVRIRWRAGPSDTLLYLIGARG